MQVEKTLSKDSLVKYLDGGFSIDAIIHQVSRIVLKGQVEGHYTAHMI